LIWQKRSSSIDVDASNPATESRFTYTCTLSEGCLSSPSSLSPRCFLYVSPLFPLCLSDVSSLSPLSPLFLLAVSSVS
jgi:hypothetical protein